MAGIWDPLVIILSVPDKRIHQSGAAWLAFAYLESSTRWEGLKLVKSLYSSSSVLYLLVYPL